MSASVPRRGVRPAPASVPVSAAVPVAVVTAWAGLLLAELGGVPVSHDALAGGSVPLPAALALFGVAWVAMVVAMMLPSGYPMLRALAGTVARSPGAGGRVPPVAAVLAGYVATWTVFGFALFAGDLGLHAALDGSPVAGAAHATLTGQALLVAGAWQLTERKRRCLQRCRHAGMGQGAGEGAAGAAAAGVGRGGGVRAGVAHGVDCVGSGWALMLVVFALGRPEVLWMAVFGAVMAYEKAGRHGLAVARLAAAGLLAASLLVTLS